eukprot:423832_1
MSFLKRPRSRCYHVKHKSKMQFILRIARTAHKLLQNPQSSTQEHYDDLKKMIGNMCKNCSFIYLSYSWKRCISIVPGALLMPINMINNNCNITKFVFCHSKLWFTYIHVHSKTIPSHKPSNSVTNCIPYSLFYSMLTLFSNHVVLLKTKHWKLITFHSSFILSLISFIEREASYENIDVNSNHNAVNIKAYNDSFRLLVYWLAYYHKLKVKYRKEGKYKNKLILYDRQIDKLTNNHNIKEPYSHCFTQYEEHKEVLDLSALQWWENKTLQTKCLREKCNITKKNNRKKFVKCANCFVAVYCSRTCAKIDWKYGYHKQCCKNLVFLKKKHPLLNPNTSFAY